MPEISRFFGIIIRMFYDEHPPPHFHVEYGEHQASLRVDTLEIVRGKLPRRVLALVAEWTLLHRAELNDNWRLADEGQPLRPIEPLE
jgi:hypothetical protein